MHAAPHHFTCAGPRMNEAARPHRMRMLCMLAG